MWMDSFCRCGGVVDKLAATATATEVYSMGWSVGEVLVGMVVRRKRQMKWFCHRDCVGILGGGLACEGVVLTRFTSQNGWFTRKSCPGVPTLNLVVHDLTNIWRQNATWRTCVPWREWRGHMSRCQLAYIASNTNHKKSVSKICNKKETFAATVAKLLSKMKSLPTHQPMHHRVWPPPQQRTIKYTHINLNHYTTICF